MPGKGIEGPIAIGDHVDASILADQNGHLGRGFAVPGSGFGRFQNAVRLLGEPRHAYLIANPCNN